MMKRMTVTTILFTFIFNVCNYEFCLLVNIYLLLSSTTSFKSISFFPGAIFHSGVYHTYKHCYLERILNVLRVRTGDTLKGYDTKKTLIHLITILMIC